MQEHEQRVINEYDELCIKHKRLGEFIVESPIFQGLSEAQQSRLNRQHAIMNCYLVVLDERITAFE
jgi:hypothetical protein